MNFSIKLLSLALPLFLACSCFFHSKQEEKRPAVVLVSIPPYAYFVERIAGETVSIDILVPPGVNPHMFEPTPKQVAVLTKSSLWISLGEPAEKKILRVAKEQNPHLAYLDLCQDLHLLSATEDPCCNFQNHCDHNHSDDEGKDRHVWLSLRLAQIQAKMIAERLTVLQPEHTLLYKENLALFLRDLDQLDKKVTTQLHPFEGQAILVSHPAFSYFCRDYHLIQLAIECEGKDPLPQDLTRTLQSAEEHQVRLVLIQAQYNNKAAILVAEKLHLPIFQVDPYAEDYLKNFERLAHLVAERKNSND